MNTLTDQPSPADPAAATALPATNSGPQLRQRAEAAFREQAAQLPPDRAPLSPEATQRLLYELQVHQIELEMQNEELRQSQTALDDVKARYFDLYDLAPVGYLTVSEKGLIREANLTAATLLGVGRSDLVRQPFARSIVPADQNVFYRCRQQLLDNGTPQACELRLVRADGLTFWAHLAATVAADATGANECRVTLTDATGRKQAEAALCDANWRTWRTASIIEGTHVGTWEWNIQTGETVFSPMWVEIIGYTLEELAPINIKTWETHVHPEDGTRSAQLLERHFAGELPYYDCECRMKHKDGHWVWVHDRGRVITRTSDGQPLMMFGTHADITARKQAEAELGESEEKFRRLAESLDDVVWLSDPAITKILFVNAAYERVWGRTRASLYKCSQSFFEQVHPEDLARVLARLAESAEGDWVSEYRIVRPDGTVRWIRDRGSPVRDEQGRIVQLAGLAIDITERKQAEIERAAIIATAPDGFIMADPAGRILEVNDAYCRMSGYSCAELLRLGIEDVETADVADFQRHLAKVITQGHDHFDARHRRKDGSVFDVAISVQFSRVRGGVFISFLQDVTERKQAEARLRESAANLRQAKEAADAANLAKSRFLANMSHEIRTPMNAILGFSQLILRDVERSGRCQPEYATTILRSGEHLLRIINDILEMARIESGRVTLNLVPFDLYRLLDDLDRMFSLRAQTKQLRFQVERQGEVPRHLLADETKLHQVLVNLLGNAVKFTPNGGAITLRIRSEPEPDGALRLHAEIEDTGMGIASEDLPHLFEPFFQTSSGRQVSGGTGLGLRISQEFVRLMGGKFEVTSQVGVGSTFRFDVRVSRAQATDAGAERTVAPGSVRLLPGQPACRVLIVDDLPDNCELLVQLLAPVGFEIRTAAGGVEAVAQCQEWSPHLVLMDLRMPGMDGHEATRRIRAAHGALVKIIALSASAFTESEQRALADGADAFISKPLQAADLLDRIKELVGVDYVDAAPQEAAATVQDEAAAERLTAGEMRRLPAELVAALREATCRADYQQMLDLVDQAATHDERLGRLLRQLVKRFDYDTLHELLAAHTPNL